MPKKDRLVLAVLGCFLAVAGLVGMYLSSLSQYQAQRPIDPATLSGDYLSRATSAVFHTHPVTVPAENDDAHKAVARVLGTTDNPKRIEVDLTSQRVYAYEGDQKVFDFLISSGKWGRTPTGTFTIWGKFRYTKMEGGKKELNTYYYLPNVPYVMFFSNEEIPAARGFSLHGTYWHSNFGVPMSHGCINMKTEEAEQLFYWAEPNLGDKKSGRVDEENPGTPVIIYGEAPKS